jgi:hypothetical protein
LAPAEPPDPVTLIDDDGAHVPEDVHVVPEGQLWAVQPAVQALPLQTNPGGHSAVTAAHGVPCTPAVGAPHTPASEHTCPLPQPAAGEQSAEQELPEQWRPTPHAASSVHDLPHSVP